MEEAREKALQEITDHYEAKLKEKEQQREQVRGIGNLHRGLSQVCCVHVHVFIRSSIVSKLHINSLCRSQMNIGSNREKERRC